MSAANSLSPRQFEGWTPEAADAYRTAYKESFKDAPWHIKVSDPVNRFLGQPTSHSDSLAHRKGLGAALQVRDAQDRGGA